MMITGPLLITYSFVDYTSNMIKKIETYKTIQLIEKSLDIVAPYVSNQELKELRSEYRQINSYAKYIEFKAKLIVLDDTIDEIELSDLNTTSGEN